MKHEFKTFDEAFPPEEVAKMTPEQQNFLHRHRGLAELLFVEPEKPTGATATDAQDISKPTKDSG